MSECRLRRIAYITHASMVQKPMSPEALWPIQEEQQTPEDNMERMIRERDAILAKYRQQQN